jgi:hypothetical protein
MRKEDVLKHILIDQEEAPLLKYSLHIKNSYHKFVLAIARQVDARCPYDADETKGILLDFPLNLPGVLEVLCPPLTEYDGFAMPVYGQLDHQCRLVLSLIPKKDVPILHEGVVFLTPQFIKTYLHEPRPIIHEVRNVLIDLIKYQLNRFNTWVREEVLCLGVIDLEDNTQKWESGVYLDNIYNWSVFDRVNLSEWFVELGEDIVPEDKIRRAFKNANWVNV